MREFEYVVTEPAGLHARPAANLVRFAAGLASSVKIGRAGAGKTANAKSVLNVLALAVKAGDTVYFEVEGATEEQDAQTLFEYCEKEL